MCVRTASYPLNVMREAECLAARPMASAAEQSPGMSDAACPATTLLPYQVDVFPFGFLVRIKSNHRSVIETAQESWSCFAPRFSTKPLELSFIVSECPGSVGLPDVTFRAQKNLLVAIADAHNSAVCDLRAGFAFAHLSEAAVRDRAYLRYNFLEALTYTVLDVQHVVAIHAACVAKNGNGFLLFGDSGAGKSSLAYACARRGWAYISDDCTFIPRRTSERVAIGNPRTFRFRPAASMLFPEVKGPVSLRNGKPTMEIKSATLPWVNTATECTVNQVIFLNRCVQQGSTPALQPVSRAELWRRISEQNAWPAELCIEPERQDTLQALLGATALQLNYTDCERAVDALERVACFRVT
jgi:hypothetical protein